jgi:hypothetical protein
MSGLLSQLAAHFAIALIFLPLILGLSALLMFTRIHERVRKRVDPNGSPKTLPPSRPTTGAGWARYVGERVLAVAVFAALFTTTRLIATTLLVATVVAATFMLYYLRVRPLRLMGATLVETCRLAAVLALCVVCFGWFIYPAIRGFYRPAEPHTSMSAVPFAPQVADGSH